MPRKSYLTLYLRSLKLKNKYLKSKKNVGGSRRWHLPWKASQGPTLKILHAI